MTLRQSDAAHRLARSNSERSADIVDADIEWRNPLSSQSRAEAGVLWQKALDLEDAKARRYASMPATIVLQKRMLLTFVAASLLLGGLVGSQFSSFGVLSRATAAGPPEAMINLGTGEVVQLTDEERNKRSQYENLAANYRPAFYCWKCKKWHPVSDPLKESAPRPPSRF